MSAVAIVDARVLTMDDERRDLERATVLVEDGEIVVTCEFCSSSYRFDPSDFDAGA